MTPLTVIGFPIAIGVLVFFAACAVAWGRDYIGRRRAMRRRLREITGTDVWQAKRGVR